MSDKCEKCGKVFEVCKGGELPIDLKESLNHPDGPRCLRRQLAQAVTREADLAAALDQIDADEALMREVMEGLEWAIAECELGPAGSGAVVALRARLGPAPEPTP